jgi:hypothetical protein
MKLEMKEVQTVDTSLLLRMGNKIPIEGVTEKSLELRKKKGPSRDCPTWGYGPYTTTKLRQYCICQQNFSDRTLK